MKFVKKGGLISMDSSEIHIRDFAPADTITFHAKEIKVSSDYLCLKFDEPLMMDLEKINVLEFEVQGKKFKYKKDNFK